MPQEMNVLCCYACKMYQVHIVKKLNKWQCKICGEKQSIQVVYFQGSGIDCRHQVQHLNSLKATKDEQQSFASPTIDKYGLDCTADENDENDIVDHCHCPKRPKRSNGKWSEYLEPSDDDDVCPDSLDEKENFATQENSEFIKDLWNYQYSTKPSYSFPGNQNYASSSDFQDESSESQACNSKSRSYPLTARTLKVFNKWDRCLDSGMEEHDTICKNDFKSAMTSSLNKKLPSKWDKYLDSGNEEQDRLWKNDFSSAAPSSSAKKMPSRWDEFLEDPNDEQGSNCEVEDGQDEAPTNNSTAGHSQSTKCNIFEDYNDDLDLTIDF